MKLYSGIDLHSNNSVIVVINENDKVLYERRHANRAQDILEVFEGGKRGKKGPGLISGKLT